MPCIELDDALWIEHLLRQAVFRHGAYNTLRIVMTVIP